MLNLLHFIQQYLYVCDKLNTVSVKLLLLATGILRDKTIQEKKNPGKDQTIIMDLLTNALYVSNLL